MLVDCMWSFGWRLEGGGEDSHKACDLFELAIVVSNHRAITCRHVRSQRLKLMLTCGVAEVEAWLWMRWQLTCNDNCVVQPVGWYLPRAGGVDRVSPARWLIFPVVLPCWLCYLPESWGLNTHAWTGGTDFSDEPRWRRLSVRSKGRGGGGGGSHVAFRL